MTEIIEGISHNTLCVDGEHVAADEYARRQAGLIHTLKQQVRLLKVAMYDAYEPGCKCATCRIVRDELTEHRSHR